MTRHVENLIADNISLHGNSTIKQVNRKWRERYESFKAYAAPPWWAPGLVLTDEVRSTYERYLPVSEFVNDFIVILSNLLPTPGWIPTSLQKSDFRSLPDLWKCLPHWLSGKVTWTHKTAWLAAFAMASPERNGTQAGRYPEQLKYIPQWQQERGSLDSVVAIDYGCGTGQGTYELANLFDDFPKTGSIFGVTREPLEAWMAAHRWLPHIRIQNSDGVDASGIGPRILSLPENDAIDLTILSKTAKYDTERYGSRHSRGTVGPAIKPTSGIECDLTREMTINSGEHTYIFPPVAKRTSVAFAAGDVTQFQLVQTVDIISCNGLIGGPNLFSDQDYRRLWRGIETQLAPGGLLIVGNHFHDGYKKRERRFFELADTVGFIIDSVAQSCFCRHCGDG